MIGRHRRQREAEQAQTTLLPSPVPPIARTAAMQTDFDVARLTAKADLIMEELDVVVKQMSAMLRESAR